MIFFLPSLLGDNTERRKKKRGEKKTSSVRDEKKKRKATIGVFHIPRRSERGKRGGRRTSLSIVGRETWEREECAVAHSNLTQEKGKRGKGGKALLLPEKREHPPSISIIVFRAQRKRGREGGQKKTKAGENLSCYSSFFPPQAREEGREKGEVRSRLA